MAAVHRAAEIHAVALRHDAMNPDHTAKPRMMPIENFQELGPVGVLKPYCTISVDRIQRCAISRPRPTPPTSPQHASGCATQTSFADRMLLHPRHTA